MKMPRILSSPIFRNTIIASIDQAMLSALSFLVSIVLIKNVIKVEYGYYAIGFSITQFLLCIQNAIVNTPLAVLLVSKSGLEKEKYTSSLFWGQFIFVLPAVVIGLCVATLANFYGFDATQTLVMAAIAFAAIGIFFKEFWRAYYFAEQMPLQVFKMDVLYVSTFVCGVCIVYLLFRISVPFMFVLMGISCILAGILFSWREKWRSNKTAIKESYRENWKFGKWALLGVIVWHIQTHSHLYLLGALIGSIAVADVSAARLLLMPMILFQEGWMKIAVPHGSKLREQKQLDRFFKEQIWVCLAFALIVVLYTVTLMSVSGLLQDLLFTERYSESMNYVFFFAVLFIVGFFGINANSGLQVTKNFDIITKVNFITMLITIALSYVLIRAYGITGGLTALIIGELLMTGTLWTYYAKIVYFRIGAFSTVSPKSIAFTKFTKD